MARRRKVDPAELAPEDGVTRVLTDDRICWFPVRHFSPASAHHVTEVIAALQPDAVLVEGPDDATAHIEALVHPDTQPPVTVLSTWVDRKNVHGLNGVLTPAEDVPVRYRGWWPFVRYSPEYAALIAGSACGAELAFIDAPLAATLPFHQARRRKVAAAVDDRALAESRYFEALRAMQRRPDFDAFWQGVFEVRGLQTDTLQWMRAVLTFAWCTRHMADDAAFADDGTALREAHMRWHVDQVRKRHDGWIVVVTGAFHSVGLPFTKGKRAKQKADRHTTTVLCAHSYAALSRLYDQNRTPAYGSAVWDALQAHDPRPHGTAARQLLVEVMREARAEGLPVSTADAVGAWRVARELADLRGDGDPTPTDLRDAIQMAYVKGDLSTAGVPLERITRRVLTGRRMGALSATAGQAPLLSAFYQAAKSHRLDLSGAHKVVRCDLQRSAAHRRKSAFLHRADLLELPMFADVDRKGYREGHFRGPDPATGEDLHLITESWGIRWQEEVDDRLLELSDRGSTLAEVAAGVVRDEVRGARGDVAATTTLLLRTAQMMLLDLFDEVLTAVEDALHADRRLLSLAGALTEFSVLYELRGGLATQGVDRLLDVIAHTWTATVLQLHQLGTLEDEQVADGVHALQDVLRMTIGFDPRPLDARLLVEQLERVAARDECPAAVRGAVLGALHALGHRSEAELAGVLRTLLAGTDAADAGPFLEGLFMVGRSVLLGGDALLAATDAVLGDLSWDRFRALLPDLRRAFTQFIPSEIDRLGSRVSAHLGLVEAVPEGPVPDGLFALVREADRLATEVVASTTA
jgi:hypothetical protein